MMKLQEGMFYLAYSVGAGYRLGMRAFASPGEAKKIWMYLRDQGFTATAYIVRVTIVATLKEES